MTSGSDPSETCAAGAMNYIFRIIGVGCYPILSENSGDFLSFCHGFLHFRYAGLTLQVGQIFVISTSVTFILNRVSQCYS